MLIFVIPLVYPNDKNLVAGSYVHEQCKVIKELGHQIVVLNINAVRFTNWKRINSSTVIKKEKDGIIVYSSNYRALMTSRLPRLAIYEYSKSLRKMFKIAILENGKPDLLHAHFSFTSGIATLSISNEYNIPFIVTEHHSLLLRSKLSKYLKNKIFQVIEKSTEFICVSNHLKNSIEKLIKINKELLVIPNIIDEKFQYKVPRANKTFSFFSAGNLVKSKNFQMLIESFSEAFLKEEDIRLMIAGDGPERRKLQKTIIKYGRQEQIKLLGRLSREEILKKYQECHCFVTTSKFETFGIVVREALAVGRPVISSKNGGNEENWNENFGILIPNNDKISCKNALQIMHMTYNEFDKKFISKITIETYSKQNFLNKINKVYLRSAE